MKPPAAELDEVALVTEGHGWQTALHDYLRARNSVAYRFAADPQSATWRLLLATPPAPHVLFIYPSVSIAPFLFAQEGARVSCACADAAVPRYIAQRAAQEGLVDVEAHLWDACGPVTDEPGTFDLVVAVGALSSALLGSRAPLRRNALMEAARFALRPGGQLLIADRSRAHPARLRTRLSLSSRCDSKQPGFAESRVHGLLPSHWQPFFILPVGPRGVARHALQRLASAHDLSEALPRAAWALWRRAAAPGVRALSALRLARLMLDLLPSYAVVARRCGEP